MIPSTFLGVDDDLIALADRLRQSTVEVRATHRGRPTGHGSGVVWGGAARAGATIVTNAHVAQTPHATVTLPDGRHVDARVVARDPRRDLATLQIESPLDATVIVPATVGDARALRPGQLVVALGHPLGVANSLSLGIVHATNGSPFRQRHDSTSHLISADIRLAPGNSGGPLANAAGEVVGINSMIANGLGVAVSSTAVTHFLAAHRPRPHLGVTVRPVTVALRGTAARVAGLLVLELTLGGPADRAGMLPGDVLLGTAQQPFASADDLLTLLHTSGANSTILLDVGRAGRRTVVPVTLGPVTAEPGQYRRAA